MLHDKNEPILNMNFWPDSRFFINIIVPRTYTNQKVFPHKVYSHTSDPPEINNIILLFFNVSIHTESDLEKKYFVGDDFSVRARTVNHRTNTSERASYFMSLIFELFWCSLISFMIFYRHKCIFIFRIFVHRLRVHDTNLEIILLLLYFSINNYVPISIVRFLILLMLFSSS